MTTQTPEQAQTHAHTYPTRWLLPTPDPTTTTLAREAHLPEILATLLTLRGVHTAAQAARFLHPSLDDLHPPSTLLGLAPAVTRIRSAIALHQPILIYGDYDVDGATAVVLLKTVLEMLGGQVRFHIPHRLREGYGIQPDVLAHAHSEGVRLVISVDTGIRAFAAAQAAQALSLDLILTDHHLPEPGTPLPQALAILNPNQPGCGYASKSLCGAGVAFKLAHALLEADAESTGDPSQPAATTPPATSPTTSDFSSTTVNSNPVRNQKLDRLRTRLLPSLLKMLAIATVSDAVPLLGENRAIVALGLQALHQPVNPGLRALFHVAQLDPARRPLTASDIGFRLGPRINAAGRMDVASDVIELFTTRNPTRATDLAQKLDQLNSSRRSTEQSILTALLDRVAQPELQQARCLVLDGDHWHRGVLGILASRIVDQTHKPTLVLSHEEGEAHGSGRSIPGFHLLSALEHCAHLFTRFGGHAGAAGFSLPSANVPALRAALESYTQQHLPEDLLTPTLACDAELPLDRITPALFRQLRLLEPTGIGNPEPIFLTPNATLSAEPRYIQDQHARLQLSEGSATYPAILWRQAARIRAMALTPGAHLAIAYKLRENTHPQYGGLELELVDLEPLP